MLHIDSNFNELIELHFLIHDVIIQDFIFRCDCKGILFHVKGIHFLVQSYPSAELQADHAYQYNIIDYIFVFTKFQY